MTLESAPAWAFQVPPRLDQDLEAFQGIAKQFQSGEVSETQFRAFRVPMGVYEQRESGSYMLRVRFPAGGVLPKQMRRLAEVAREFGDGILHVTTRQDIQVHRVPLKSLHPALVSLRQAGLATKGGGGNTVRNITACCDSGVCPDGVFDVAPHAVALTERLMADPLSFQLPRKYKIAFSACPRDCSAATVNDLGFVARRKDGVDGFSVYVGGGMGAKSRAGSRLHDFIPAADVFLVAEAVKRVFDKHGDRKNKHLARLRFLVERLGDKSFRQRYEQELAALRATPPPPLQIRTHPTHAAASRSSGPPPTPVDATRYSSWCQNNVIRQKQSGYYLVNLPLALGDLEAETMAALAEVVAAHGEGMLCATQAQNLALRWVTQEELPVLYHKLTALALAEPQPPVLRNLVACTGAATCRLGICLSRGLVKAVAQQLRHSGLALEKLGDLRIHISGCPNSCGRHPVADIGFYGAARRVEGHLLPYYAVQIGGRVGEGQTRLAQRAGTIPAKNVPAFLQDFLAVYLQDSAAPDFHRFVDQGGRKLGEDIAARCRQVPAFEANPGFYRDWDSPTPFSLAGRGPGECSSGVFDLIEVDLASAEEALRAGRLYEATILAARSLLITRGEQPTGDLQVLQLFQKHFVAEGLVDRKLERLITSALEATPTPNRERKGAGDSADVAALVKSVRLLYENMDASLRFKPVPVPPAAAPPASGASATHDFRGVACPLNYVKTKMALSKLQKGQNLLVLLDEEGAKNVPESAAKDGHTVLSVTPGDGHWQVLLRKG